MSRSRRACAFKSFEISRNKLFKLFASFLHSDLPPGRSNRNATKIHHSGMHICGHRRLA